MKIRSALFFLLLALISLQTYAHKPSDSFLNIERNAGNIVVNWSIAARDLEVALGIDTNNDGKIQWGELRDKEALINQYALNHLALSIKKKNCSSRPAPIQIENKNDGAYVYLTLPFLCQDTDAPLTLGYRLLFDIDPTHRGLIAYTQNGQTITRVTSPESAVISFDIIRAKPFSTFRDYTKEGIWHIWIGFDHILFLVTLLLPAVLVFRQKQWHAVPSVGLAIVDTTKIVTAFTVAHSFTLALAVFEIFTLPSRFIESVIAFSILLVAINNLRPFFSSSRWILAFVFGLIHGFGFANVLIDLGLPTDALATALLGFNIGVELGQLAIVLAFLPIAGLVRNTMLYQSAIVKGGSIVAGLLASIWMFERTFDYSIIPI